MIEVEPEQRERPRLGRLRHLVRQTRGERRPVRQTCQRIVLGHIGDLLLGPQPFSDIGTGDQPAALGGRAINQLDHAAVMRLLLDLHRPPGPDEGMPLRRHLGGVAAAVVAGGDARRQQRGIRRAPPHRPRRQPDNLGELAVEHRHAVVAIEDAETVRHVAEGKFELCLGGGEPRLAPFELDAEPLADAHQRVTEQDEGQQRGADQPVALGRRLGLQRLGGDREQQQPGAGS